MTIPQIRKLILQIRNLRGMNQGRVLLISAIGVHVSFRKGWGKRAEVEKISSNLRRQYVDDVVLAAMANS